MEGAFTRGSATKLPTLCVGRRITSAPLSDWQHRNLRRMLKTEQIAVLFDNARTNSSDSLKRLDDAEKHWDRHELLRSAEKAWAAATQATDALIMARIGIESEPHGENDTYGLLSKLAREAPELAELKDKYTDFSVFLFDLVICNGNLDPLEITIEDIRKTADYTLECERLAGVEGE